MSDTDLDDFYKFWRSLGVDTNADAVIRPCSLFHTGSGHSSITYATTLPSTGIGGKIFNLQDFELMSRLHEKTESGMRWPITSVTKAMDLSITRVSDLTGVEDLMQLMFLMKYYFSQEKDRTIYLEYCNKIEDILYITNDSCYLKPNFEAAKSLQLSFNIHRAHLKFETNQLEEAKKILTVLANEWMEIDKTTQTNILYENFVYFLCSNDWEKAYNNLKRMGQIIKLMNSQDRHNWGAWDDWTLVLIITWYFAFNIPDFYKFITNKINSHADCFISNKKVILIKTLSSKQIAMLLPDKYYEKAIELNKTLPAQ